MGDATASLNAALLGLDGFVVVTTAEVGGELELLVETTADLVGCPGCGAVARAKDRRPTWVRDLPCSAVSRASAATACWAGGRWCCAGGSTRWVTGTTQASPAFAGRGPRRRY